MAVDSHDDNQYELTVGNVNNNNNSAKKPVLQTSIKLESRDDTFGLDLVEDDDSSASLFSSYSSDPSSSQNCQGSRRRKLSSVSKGITIEEFLSKEESRGQLSVIDKLILKNKVALRSVQMKQTRSKMAPAAQATASAAVPAPTTNGKEKKEAKPRKEKVLGSKIAVAKKRTANAAVAAASEATKKTKKVAAAKVKVEAKPEPKRGRPKPKPILPRPSLVQLVKRRSETPAPDTVPTQKAEKASKKEKAFEPSNRTRKPKEDVKTITKMKKKITNKSDKLIDLKTIKPNVSHKTRSFNKGVQLRNGKSRIVPDKKTAPPSPQPRKYNRRSVANTSLNDSASNETLVNGAKPSPAPLKRSIKQEPMDEDPSNKSKRRRTGKLNASRTSAGTPDAPAVAPGTPATVPGPEIGPSTPAIVPGPATVASVTPAVLSGAPAPATIADTPVASVAPEKTNPIPKLTPESTSIPAQIPILKQELPSPIPKPKATPQATPIIPTTLEKAPPLSIQTPSMDQAPSLERDTVSSSSSDISLVIEDSSEPPILSPALPTILGDTIVIDSTGESDTDSEESPPVITAQTATPANAAKSSKPDLLEDTATETSEDTEGDEEFALQDANTESEDVIDEDISLQYVTDDDEDSTDKDIANEPTVAAVATAADPVKEPKEPVESAREKIAPVVEEPKVVPSQEKQPKQPITQVQDRPENKAVKESILGALGLQSLEKVQQKVKENNNYTGTLKAVIKIDKGCRRMELKPKDSGATVEGLQPNENVLSFYSKIMPSKFDHVSDSASGGHDRANPSEGHVNGVNHDEGLLSSLREANRNIETDYSLIDPVSGLLKEKTKAAASLVVPEKSSSFSIHPNRLCSDVCKYCFGKFGSLDTPCHVGQMKNPERQRKILLCEPNLKMDTCLCDACYRFVDRKANKPPSAKRNKNMRRSISINQRNLGPCVVQNCSQFARHTVKRKWLLRISKKIAKLSFDVNKRGPRMQYGLCSQHYYMVDFYTCCGVCKKRLNRNHMYSIRSELNEMNTILEEDRIPVKLVDNMLLCKLCHYYMSLRRKYGSSAKMSPSNRQYYHNFRQKVLEYYNVQWSDSEDVITSECLKYESTAASMVEVGPQSPEIPSLSSQMIGELSASSSKTSATTANNTNGESNKRPSSGSSSSSKKTTNHNVGIREIADLLKPLEGGDGDKNSTRIQVKFGNLNIGKLSNLNIGQNSSTHQSEAKHDKSGDKEMPIIADFCFETPAPGLKNLEKCVSTIQFDKGTKKLWQDLQKPYGNQSSFIRHLITLEKHWRSGALVLAQNADPGAVKYINSVQNRIQSFEMTSSSATASPAPTPPPAAPTPPPATAAPAISTSKPRHTMEQIFNKMKNHIQSLEMSTASLTPSACRTPTSNQTSKTPTPAVSAPKTTSLPTLKPVTSSANDTASSNDSSSSSAHVRHTPAPPPLLKIDQMNGQFGGARKVVVSSESKTQQAAQIAARNAERAISLQQYVGMMHPQPRTKHPATVVTNGTAGYRVSPISVANKKAMPTMKPIHIANSSSVESMVASNSPQVSKKSASVVYQGTANIAKPNKPYYTMSMPAMPQLTAISTVSKKSPEPSSMIIAKLPKALTVTQIDDAMPNQKMASGDRASITAPFMAGEKPSVSVFREITK